MVFFFNRLRINDTDRYKEEFPYISPCGRERNYVRCDDQPIVFTHILAAKGSKGEDLLSYNWAGDRLTVIFEPQSLCMYPDSGRVYHPASLKTGGVGLVRSTLAIELSKTFEFADGESFPPTHFIWNGKSYKLTNKLFKIMGKNSV